MKVSTRKYVDNQVRWLKMYTDAEMRAVREAVDKVETTNTAKFEAQNEWRSQFKDQTTRFVTKAELWAAALAIISILGGIIAFLKQRI
jgi:hypothetical protein